MTSATRHLLASFLGILLLPAGALAGPFVTVVDQEQAVTDPVAPTWAIGGPSQQRLAQTLTTGVDGTLDEVQLPVGCADGTLIVEIRDLAGSEPGTTVLARTRIRADRLPVVVGTFQAIPIRGHVVVAPGDSLAIVLSNPTGSCGIASGPAGDSYTGGGAFYESLPNPPGWVAFPPIGGSLDLPFRTLVRTRP